MWWGRPSYFWGGVLIIGGVLALLANAGLLNNLDWNYVWPGLLIAIGVWQIVIGRLPRSADAPAGGAPLDRSDPREGLAKAKLDVGLGSVRIELHGAALGDQLDRARGTVRITHPGNWMMGGWGRVELDLQLSDAIPWEAVLKTGAARGTI